jgi:hypothetical protein
VLCDILRYDLLLNHMCAVDDINWVAVAAVGQIIAAIATFIAIWVSLSSARHKATISMEKFSITQTVEAGEYAMDYHVIRITNTGSPPIVLHDLGMFLPQKIDIGLGVFLKQNTTHLNRYESIDIRIPSEVIKRILKQNNLFGDVKAKLYFVDARGIKFNKRILLKNT